MTKLGDVHGNGQAVPKLTRCAVYARYSCDLSRPASIEDQVRKCTQECQRHDGWTIVPEFVVSDEAVSGRSLAGRDGMEVLKRAAKKKPRPFDCVLIDDTSRFGRNLGDVLKLAEFFKHYGVSLHFVSPPLDSTDQNFYQLLVFKGMMDEQYSLGLADKVWRGLEGRVLKGYNAGAACYGYRNVAEVDPNGKGDGVIGVQLQIITEQAEVVRRIFEMYANGSSLDRIAQVLRAASVPAPRPPRRNSVRGWSADGIAEILRNKKYIGINEWGRTKGVRDPETGQIQTRPRPEAEWVRHENPKWRIVEDELWNRVQEQLALKSRLGIPKNGGLNRTSRSRRYLFSGLLRCGICEGPINIIDGNAGGEVVWYGCSAHRYKGACTNVVNIRRDRLEEQLLPWLIRDLPLAGQLGSAANAFHAKVQERISQLRAEVRSNAVNSPELRNELKVMQDEASNIVDVMARIGRNSSPRLEHRLQTAERRILEIETLLARTKEPEPIFALSLDDLRKYLAGKLDNLRHVLASSPEAGRQVLQKHIRKITLTPGQVEGKRVLYVALEFELGGTGGSGVLLTDSLDAFRQQYGFSAITVTGLCLDTSRVRRKPKKITETSCPTVPAVGTNSAHTQAADSAQKEIAA